MPDQQSQLSTETIVQSIIYHVSDLSGIDPLDLPTLYDVLDPTCLERLVESADDSVTVEFDYFGYHVRVDGDGNVQLIDQGYALESMGIGVPDGVSTKTN